MANTREILTRIKSIEDTCKITNAMYMISSTKMKKAKAQLEHTEPYFFTLQSTIARILRHVPDMANRYLDTEKDQRLSEEKRRGLIVITADKGLAGAYNHNVLKLAEEWLQQGQQEDTLFVVGELGRHFFEGKKIHVSSHFRYTAQNPSLHRARMIGETILDRYQKGQLEEVWVVFTTMNGMETEPKMERLLPLKRKSFAQITENIPMEEFYLNPSPGEVLDHIVPNYVTGFIFGALVESFCSEQEMRMMAMEAATDSANEMIKRLSVLYNRGRQAAITQEVTEVISGAKAQKRKKEQKKKKQRYSLVNGSPVLSLKGGEQDE